jgi:hypothetical protein
MNTSLFRFRHIGTFSFLLIAQADLATDIRPDSNC